MSRYRQDNQRHDAAEQEFPGGEARVPVIAVREDLLRAVTDAARTTGAVTVCCDTTQLAERWESAAVVVLDEPAAAALMTTTHARSAPRDGRPTVLLYSGRLVDMPPGDAVALWKAADALEVTHVLPHGDWLDDAPAQAWAAFLGATLATGNVPLQADEYDHGAGRTGGR